MHPHRVNISLIFVTTLYLVGLKQLEKACWIKSMNMWEVLFRSFFHMIKLIFKVIH